MDAPAKLPLSVVIGRIASIIGFSFAVAIGILLLLGGVWTAGIIALALSLPFVLLLRFVEYRAERGLLRR